MLSPRAGGLESSATCKSGTGVDANSAAITSQHDASVKPRRAVPLKRRVHSVHRTAGGTPLRREFYQQAFMDSAQEALRSVNAAWRAAVFGDTIKRVTPKKTGHK